MAPSDVQRNSAAAWRLVRRQHGIVARAQLIALGFTPEAIKHRIATGRLHPIYQGVYAVGRADVTPHGRWMAAVLRCGRGAAVSHRSAAALWGIRADRRRVVDLSVPLDRRPRCQGLVIHRRTLGPDELTRRHGIPVVSVICTIIDLAAEIQRGEVEQAINEADKLGLTNPVALRNALDHMPRRPGAAALRKILDYHTFVLTESQLERLFLPIAYRVGLPKPITQRYVNSSRVDFYWPDLGLVVETDGLTYHRTPAQQAKDLLSMQRHAAAELVPLRFSHAQIKYEPQHVEAILGAVAARLMRQRAA